MELFRVETGAVPARSCSEETMPMLKRSPKKNDSKVFLVNDSLASIANMSLMFADPARETKEYPSSPVKQKDSESDPPNYLQLSPKNLKDPIRPSTKTKQFSKCSSETECLLGKTNNVLNSSEKTDSRPCSRRPLKDEIESRQSSTMLALATSQGQQASTSSVCSSSDSPPGSSKKKTLGELAKEWNSNQSPDQVKAEEIKINKTNKTVVLTSESDHALVRHSTYYSTSSSVHGESSHDFRLRNKLNTRRHLIREEAYQVKKNDSPSLLQLHAVATE